VNTRSGQIEELAELFESNARRTRSGSTPTAPNPDDRTVTFVPREREPMLDVTLDTLEVEGPLAFLSFCKAMYDSRHADCAAIFREPPSMIAIYTAVPSRLVFPDFEGRQVGRSRQSINVVNVDGTDRKRPIDRVNSNLAGTGAFEL
jgi:hypothetical protein